MPSTIKTLEQMTYDTVRSSSFAKIHGRPTQSDYENFKKEASDLASELDNITYDWSRSPTGDEYGLLAEIIGEDEYYHLTNLTWTQEVEPATYDPTINDTTATYTRKQMEQEWECTRKTWAIGKGFLWGVAANFCDALDESWYSQLKSVHTAYRNTTPIQILEHLNSRWCPLEVHAKKNLRIAYYAEWDGEQYLTAFGKRLDKDQVRIERFGITISDKDKLQFYLEQMYASNHFDKKEMTEWENKPEAIKNDFNNAKTYFEGLIRDYEVYKQNSGSTAGKHNFESANQATKANCGEELCQYIAGIAQAAVKQEEQAANIRDSTKASTDTMATQIKAMSDQIAQLTKAMANKENAPNSSSSRGSSGSSSGRGRDKGQARYVAVQYTKPRSMGSCCSLHSFHPAGENYTSATCMRKLPKHKTTTTWNDRKGGSVHWPPPIHSSIEQQNHATYAGKLAPTN
jgi:hypothetical protein